MPPRRTFRPNYVNLHYIAAAIDQTILDLKEIKKNAKDSTAVQKKIATLQKIKLQVRKACPQNFFEPFDLK
jgi:hypothetical protein